MSEVQILMGEGSTETNPAQGNQRRRPRTSVRSAGILIRQWDQRETNEIHTWLVRMAAVPYLELRLYYVGSHVLP